MCYLLWASFRWMLPHSITRPGTIIVNTDAHTQTGSHRLAIRLEPRSSSAFYFDSYGLSPNVLDIQTFLRRNCTVLNYTIQLQGPMSTVCGQYCCMFALYTDRLHWPAIRRTVRSPARRSSGGTTPHVRMRISTSGTSRRSMLHP